MVLHVCCHLLAVTTEAVWNVAWKGCVIFIIEYIKAGHVVCCL